MTNETIRILAIDDNADIRDLLRFVLEKEGFEVSTSANGVDGLSQIKERRPDIVLLDVMMPEFSGFDVLDAIRNDKDSKVRVLPVLMITAKSSIEDVDRALELGATSYIVKPFRPTKLVEKVNELLALGQHQGV
ncbi:MAG: response regulator [Actinobacteria bacterium]|nr:response regulator [Actinomycetota bacterium]